VPDKAQVDVMYGYAGQLKRSDPEFYREVVLNTILGGGSGLASRLATSVRDRLGLVYGIYADTDAGLGAGPFVIQFGTNPQNVRPGHRRDEPPGQPRPHQGFTAREVEQAKSYITGTYAVTLATNAGVSEQLMIGDVYGSAPTTCRSATATTKPSRSRR
jgi:zinc protease